MKATITPNVNGFVPSFRKENHFREEFAAIAIKENGEAITCVTLRIYGTDACAYSCVWLHTHNTSNSGSGRAGGYGYHRASAAAEDALRRAGVELSEDIGGRGDGAISEAVRAAALALIPEASMILVHHAHA